MKVSLNMKTINITNNHHYEMHTHKSRYTYRVVFEPGNNTRE